MSVHAVISPVKIANRAALAFDANGRLLSINGIEEKWRLLWFVLSVSTRSESTRFLIAPGWPSLLQSNRCLQAG